MLSLERRRFYEALVLRLCMRHQLAVDVGMAILKRSKRGELPEDVMELLKEQEKRDVSYELRNHPALDLYLTFQ